MMNQEISTDNKMNNDEIVLRPSRWKMLLLLLTCLAFVVIFVWMFLSGEDQLIAILGGLFFGLGIAVSVAQLLPNSSSLRLDCDGFTVRSLYRESRMSWHDVAQFYPIKVSRNPMIGIAYAEGYDGMKIGRQVAGSLTGVEGAIPDTYGMKSAELATLMNTYLAKYGQNNSRE